MRAAPSVAGLTAGVGVGAALVVAGGALLAAVLVPVALAWARPAGGLVGALMFANFAPAALAAVGVAYLPVVLLAAVGADVLVYAVVASHLGGRPLRAGLASAAAMGPALGLAALSSWAVLTLLATLATVGASSYGRRLPGDPGNRTYLVLAAVAALAGGTGALAWVLGGALRPWAARRLHVREEPVPPGKAH